MRKITGLVVHCSDTRPIWDGGVDDIRAWHTAPGWRGYKNGWSDVGYHAVIRRDGSLEPGRPIKRAGAHVLGENAHTLGVCLIGGHGAAATDHFHDHFTEEQRRTLVSICLIAQGFGLTIHGHNEFASKGCPGFSVAEFLKGLT